MKILSFIGIFYFVIVPLVLYICRRRPEQLKSLNQDYIADHLKIKDV